MRWSYLALVVGFAVACSNGGNNTTPDLGSTDMARSDGPSSGGAIGSACASTADCHGGTTPVCWRTTLFNRTMYLKTHGGYCSSACTADTDCGTGNHCADFGGTIGKFCLAGCMGPAEACPSRTGYACFLDNNCFPTDNLTCDPKSTDGSCMTFAGKPGGCQRAAFGTGTRGFCEDQCSVGVNTCQPSSNGTARHCIVDDQRRNTDETMALYGDKWVGPLCFTKPDPIMFPPVALGSECKATVMGMTVHYSDICVEGAECYLKGMAPAGMGFDAAGDNNCHQMCYLLSPMPPDGGFMFPDGGTIATMACPGAQTCTDIWGLTGTGRAVGLCK